jgi:hypothetical protein
VLDSYRERQHPDKMNPAMRYCKSAPDADQTKANDGRKTKVLTCHNASRRNPPGKEQSQEKGIIDIRNSKRRYACTQYSQISIHKGLYLSFRGTWRAE